MGKKAKFANIILGSIIFISLSMFFYALLKSNMHASGSMHKYYIISIAATLFITYVLFRCPEELKLNVAICLISTLIGIYIIEIVLSYNSRIMSHNKIPSNLAKYLIPLDPRNKSQATKDLRSRGINAYPSINPNEEIFTDSAYLKKTSTYSLGYISGKTTVLCNESGEWITYESDEHGFHNPQGLYNERNLDIALIGDSYVHGYCVKSEDNIAGRLRRTGKKVLNLGIGASSSLNHLAILKEYGKPLKPKTVFWFFYEGNDYGEFVNREKNLPHLLKYLDKDFSQDLINKQELIDKFLINYIDKDCGFAFEQDTKAKREELLNKITVESTLNISSSTIKLKQLRLMLGMLDECTCKKEPLFSDVFKEAKRLVNEWDGQLIFVYLPEWTRYAGKTNLCRKRYLNSVKNDIFAIIKDLQIPIIDIQEIFDSYPEPLFLFPFRAEGHYNSQGYILMGNILEKYLENNSK